MKTPRALAAAAAILIAGAGIFAGGAAAQADDFYLTASDLTATETAPYSAGWFRGNVTGTAGTISSGVGGLTASGGQFQLLNGTPGATNLTTVAPGITMTSGAASFQIPIFTVPGAGYTTLYADAASIALGAWYTTNAVGTFTAGSAHTLADYQTEFPTLEILAFGFNKIAGGDATIAALDWNGDTYYFLPTPTATLTPSTVTPAALATTGVTLTASGFIPGESVDVFISYGQSGDLLQTVEAGADGVASYTFIAAAGDTVLTPGSYTLGGFGNDSGASAAATLVVSAAAVTPAGGPALAATGTDSIVPVIAGGALLLGGAVFMIFAARRREADAI